jgi:hypothetical protein
MDVRIDGWMGGQREWETATTTGYARALPCPDICLSAKPSNLIFIRSPGNYDLIIPLHAKE